MCILLQSEASETQPPQKLQKTTLSSKVPEVDVPTTSNRSSSHTILFSDKSPGQPKMPTTKTSWKSEPKVKVMGIEPRQLASGSSLGTKQRLFNKNSGSNPDLKTKQPAPPTKRNSFAGLGFKKVSHPPAASGSGSPAEPDSQLTTKEPLFADMSTYDSPASYHNVQDDIPLPDSQEPAGRDLASAEQR